MMGISLEDLEGIGSEMSDLESCATTLSGKTDCPLEKAIFDLVGQSLQGLSGAVEALRKYIEEGGDTKAEEEEVPAEEVPGAVGELPMEGGPMILELFPVTEEPEVLGCMERVVILLKEDHPKLAAKLGKGLVRKQKDATRLAAFKRIAQETHAEELADFSPEVKEEWLASFASMMVKCVRAPVTPTEAVELAYASAMRKVHGLEGKDLTLAGVEVV